MQLAFEFFGFGALFWITASVWKSLFHEFILDIGPRQRALLFRLKRYLPALWDVHFNHGVLHHYQTYRSAYTLQFSSEVERTALIGVLQQKVSGPILSEIVKSHFGSTFNRSGHLPYAVPIGANCLWLFAAKHPADAMVILAANLLCATPYFVFSKWVHIHMHAPFSDVALAPAPIRWILRSPYGVATRISHFVHHRDPKCNFNLQYFADRVRGRWRAPPPAEWDDMIAIDLITPAHRRRFEGRHFLLHPF